MKFYTLITLISLIFTLSLNVPYLAPALKIESISGVLVLMSIPLLIGQILLIFLNANRDENLGRILIRYGWISLFVITCCVTLMTFANFFSYFIVVIYSFPIPIVIGISLAILCYFTINVKQVWTFE